MLRRPEPSGPRAPKGAEVALHAWCDQVVHVHLYSGDEELARTCARLLEQRFADREVDTMVEPGYVEVRSSQDKPLSAGDVAERCCPLR